MTTQIYMFSVFVDEIQSALDFYTNILGLHQDLQIEGNPHLQVGDSYLVIQQGKHLRQAAHAHLPVLALSVEDLDLILERIEKNEISLVSGIEELENARWVNIFDPSGNLVELIEFYPTLMFGP